MKEVVCIGEPLLRFSTSAGTRLQTAENLEVQIGGSELNVAISLALYDVPVRFATALPNNPLGEAVKQHLHRYQVPQIALPYSEKADARLGSYFVETGYAVRSPKVVYDRKHSAFSNATEVLQTVGATLHPGMLIHISGITPALDSNWRNTVIDLLEMAKEKGCLISFDCNYRQQLWTIEQARECFIELLPLVDYCSIGVRDIQEILQIAPIGTALEASYKALQQMFPNLRVCYGTTRTVFSNENHQLRGHLWDGKNQQLCLSRQWEIEAICDRIGGGDAYAGAILAQLVAGHPLADAVEFATAAAVLKHTIQGDCNQFTAQEVESYVCKQTAAIQR